MSLKEAFDIKDINVENSNFSIISYLWLKATTFFILRFRFWLKVQIVIKDVHSLDELNLHH
jgi:hypothetical protein